MCSEIEPLQMTDYVGGSEDLMALANEVFLRIPNRHRRCIRAACDRVEFLNDFDGCDYEAMYLWGGVQDSGKIEVIVTRLRQFSPEGQRGIIAHEFGHAYDTWVLGRARKLSHAENERDRGEDVASWYAYIWGYFEDLQAMFDDSRRLRQERGETPSNE